MLNCQKLPEPAEGLTTPPRLPADKGNDRWPLLIGPAAQYPGDNSSFHPKVGSPFSFQFNGVTSFHGLSKGGAGIFHYDRISIFAALPCDNF